MVFVLDLNRFGQILDACPVLEELTIRRGDFPDMPAISVGTLVEHASIKRLVIVTDHTDHHADYHLSLDYFDIAIGLVAAIRNITTLHLSPDSLEVFHFCCESMPMFNNLLNLSIKSNKQKGWQGMPLLLKSCPILQTLLFKGLVHKVTNRCGDACVCSPSPSQKKMKMKKKVECCLWTCRVKVLEISDYGGRFRELKQMRHFLGNLECLETVKVGVDPDKNSEFVRANVTALPRLSSKCTIQFT
ncbi:F-box/LRR-repeat protein At1g48400-like isoform X2 [Raphanus sativus]|uniref:F-box/LRR-repeat protein At1g48400-like isoform X2 n=1 Tax=Raphanus sativus TaxID=3726 RepID=A0A9W3D5E5_RAPSA|nr:F-box/LRR-repeat protein At1g48400-like isoform X2 [Raphanus sativus]